MLAPTGEKRAISDAEAAPVAIASFSTLQVQLAAGPADCPSCPLSRQVQLAAGPADCPSCPLSRRCKRPVISNQKEPAVLY